MKINEFDESLKHGNICEKMVREKFKNVFSPILTQYIYGSCRKDTEFQRNGIDFSIKQKELTFDVKCRSNFSYKYKDILLETVSVMEEGKAGWLYYSESDIIVYVWQNKNRDRFIDGYLVFLEEAKNFYDSQPKNKFYTKIATTRGRRGEIWHTENVAIPVSAFPDNAIMHIDKRRLNPPEETRISDWFE